MEIVQERLEREFSLDLIASAPSVAYRVVLIGNRGSITVDNPALFPNAGEIEAIEEPWVSLSVITPATYIGPLMELSTSRRGTFVNLEYLDPQRVQIHFELPLAELIIDYFDQLKSRSQGYASMDYEEIGYRAANLVKLDIVVAGEPVDALSLIVHRDRAPATGRQLTEKLKELIPRQMFEVPIQAAIGGNVVARETVRAMRKNVLAKCYGGDITRKKKLLEKQKEGEAAHEAGWLRGDPPGGVPRRPADGRRLSQPLGAPPVESGQWTSSSWARSGFATPERTSPLAGRSSAGCWRASGSRLGRSCPSMSSRQPSGATSRRRPRATPLPPTSRACAELGLYDRQRRRRVTSLATSRPTSQALDRLAAEGAPESCRPIPGGRWPSCSAQAMALWRGRPDSRT